MSISPTEERQRFQALSDKTASLRYWRASLGGLPRCNDLPLDRVRPARRSDEPGAVVTTEIGAELSRQLRSAARKHGVPLNTVLFTGVALLTQRLTGNSEFALGTMVSNPDRTIGVGTAECDAAIVAVPLAPHAESSVDRNIQHVNDRLIEAQKYTIVPFNEVAATVTGERDDRRNPIFDIMVLFDSCVDSGLQRCDLSFQFTNTRPELGLLVEYRESLLDEVTAQRWADRLNLVLRQLTAEGDIRAGDLTVLPDTERQLVVDRWNDTAGAFPDQSSLWDLFVAQSRLTPDAVAVVDGDESSTFSYLELRERAEAVAAGLASRGARPGTMIGVHLAGGTDLVLALLGVLAAGAAYVPLGPDYPLDRLAFMTQNADVMLTVSDPAGVKRLSELGPPVVTVETLQVDVDSDVDVERAGPNDLAYVIYTSGSTGKPKGVMVEHRGVVNNIDWMIREFEFGPRDRILQKTPVTFDVSVLEIFGSLLSGAALVLLPPGHDRDPELILDCVARMRVTYLHFVPSMLSVLLWCDDITERTGSLRLLACIGEALSPSTSRAVLDRIGCRLMNLYGPTEVSVHVSAFEVTVESLSRRTRTVPIGRPIANTALYVVDSVGSPVPIGVEGDLLIGGVGLARGYINAPELTDARYVPNCLPGTPGIRLYRSGDKAMWNSAGELEFLGRNDNQVKLRGLRIELEEIEQAIVEVGLASEAAVAVHGTAESAFLVAYLVNSAEHREKTAFARILGERLPQYMVPQVVQSMDSLPLSPNGKLNRKALLPPEV